MFLLLLLITFFTMKFKKETKEVKALELQRFSYQKTDNRKTKKGVFKQNHSVVYT